MASQRLVLPRSPGFWGDEREGDAPADRALFCQRAVELIPARAGCIDKDAVLTCGLELTDELIEVTWAGADMPERDDLRVMSR